MLKKADSTETLIGEHTTELVGEEQSQQPVPQQRIIARPDPNFLFLH
jgi:hypothetical protein